MRRVRYHSTNRLGSVNILLFNGEDPEDVKRGLQKTTKKRQAEPVEIATLIAFLLTQEARLLTGAVYNVNGDWMC